MYSRRKSTSKEPEETATVENSQRDLVHGDGASHVPATSGAATLLPRSIASFVSFVTQSTSLSLRLGTFFGGFALDGARATTLTGFELSRAMIEGILTRAGRDVAIKSGGERGKAEAESLLERSLATLHTTVTSASFFAAATFHFSSTTLSSVSHTSQALLSTLDAILGSTESSRAIAAIITLIRREFRGNVPSPGGERIGVGDLLVGTVGFALLQNWGRRNTERYMHESGGDEMIWDVVILDNGTRADVVQMNRIEFPNPPRGDLTTEPKCSSFMTTDKDEGFDAVQRRGSIIDVLDSPHLSLSPENEHQVSDEDIRLYIMKQLPRGCHASIRTDMVTARTITVDVFDDNSAEISPPPGTMMIEERFHDDQDATTPGDQIFTPKHTVVFRTALNQSQSADVKPPGGHDAIQMPQAGYYPTDNDPHPFENTSATRNVEDTRTTNSSFAKGPFTRLAQKMKPSHGEYTGRPSLSPPLPITSSIQHKGAIGADAGNTKSRSPPSAANRGALRSPVREPSGVKTTPARSSTRPRSPLVNNHMRSSSSMSLTRSEADLTISVNEDGHPGSASLHRRSKSLNPSIYSLATAGSETSLILAHRSRHSPYEDSETIQALTRDGMVPGIFPEKHFVLNIRRFCRFSVASYGSSAHKVMGVHRNTRALPPGESDSNEHSDFSDHAGLPPSTILLSSFVDPEGGSNAAGETETGFPLVHFVCLDHESKAVVLTLRGTWGFEDILTDMTCDYDSLVWQGKSWKVHKGMHASAKRLLEGGGGRVMITIKAALEQFPGYGVVLCGHSLGGGVAALLATMISEPNQESGTSFMTACYQSATQRMLPARRSEQTTPQPFYFLPPGRPIHVYTYGPPAVMSPSLRRATRGLITTVVNGQDVVPTLSLGILHDMHAVSLAFKSDTSGTKSNVRYRVWENLRQSIVNKFYVNEAPMLVHAGDGIGEDVWAWQTLKDLRNEMSADKLMPPGEVFVVETMRVLQRDSFTNHHNNNHNNLGDDGYPRLGKPATRVQLKFIRDVEALFGELRFGSGMLSDHNPARYETSLAALARGILDE